MRSKLVWLAGFLASCIAFGAVKGVLRLGLSHLIPEPSAQSRASSAGGGAAGGKRGGESAPRQKINAYVGCFNAVGHGIEDDAKRYGEWLKASKAPDGPRATMSAPPSITAVSDYQLKTCREGIAAANALEPSNPDLERRASAFVTALEGVASIHAEASKYYQRKDYRDDKFTKGRELHPRLVTAWKTYEDSRAALYAVFRPLKDEEERKELSEVEKTGPRTVYHVMHAMASGRQLLAATDVDLDQLFALDPAPLQARADEICKDEDGFNAALKAEPESTNKTVQQAFLPRSLSSFCVEAKELVRRVRERRRFSSVDLLTGLRSVSGSPVELRNKYNELVNDFNQHM